MPQDWDALHQPGLIAAIAISWSVTEPNGDDLFDLAAVYVYDALQLQVTYYSV